MRAVIVQNHGGPEMLTLSEAERPTPSSRQVLVEVRVAGVNYMDVYQRTGAVPREVPFTLGVEGVGVVTDVGADVTEFSAGDRIGWFSGGSGSHADFATVEAGRAVKIPDDVPDELATAALMQGITAQYLATDTYPVNHGDTVLIHAAAGGVGQLLSQIVRLRGGRVIGTTSSQAKAQAARAAGAHETIGYDSFAEEVRELTGGVGVAAVFDGVGKSTFDGSLASLRPRGVLAIYGTASGPTPPLEIPRLNAGGSLYVTRPSIAHYTAETEEMRARATQVLGWVASGELKVQVGRDLPLDDVVSAYTDLEARNTTGKLLLHP